MYPILLAGFLLFGVCFILEEPEAPPVVPPSTNAPSAGTATMFPLEVLGSDGSTKSFSVHVTNGHLATNLFLKAHGISYPGKMSVRINGGSWVTLNNENTYWPYKLERSAWKMGWLDAYAIQNPPMATLRFGYPMAPGTLVDGVNTFDFRFNDLNGATVGYRVLDLNPQASGTNLLSASQKPQDDPLTWTLPPGGDPVAGEFAWTNLVLTDRINGVVKTIKAKCSTCHSPSGFDLKYFNYSNESIIQRASVQHGVPPVTATNMAAYIRSNSSPFATKARPWNPPYQPGPGLDALPVYHWAAGAGLENVLDNDLDTLNDIWPSGITTNYLNLTNIVNARQIRLSMQFPDVNNWFPQIAPEDCYDGLENSEFVQMYHTIIAKLDTLPSAVDRAKYFNSKKSAWDAAGSRMGIVKPPQDDPGYTEWSQKDESMRKWRVWRTFQIMNEYGIQENGPDVFPTYVEAATGQTFPPNTRTWFHGEVFNLSPHKIGRLKYDGFSIQSAMWYQVQLVLNDGQRHNPAIVPIDWGYQHALLVGSCNNPESYLLFGVEALNCIKGLQVGVQGLPLSDQSSFRYGRERLEYFQNSPEKVGIFGLIPIETRRLVGNALVLLDLQVAQWFTKAQFLSAYSQNQLDFYETHLDYYGPRMAAIGMDPNIVTMWNDWGAYLFDTDRTITPEFFDRFILLNDVNLLN